MRFYKVIIVSITFLSLLSSTVQAQSHGLMFKHLTIKDGLPGEFIQNIIQDHKGFMWFATDNGICRYDGYSIKAYKYNPSDSSGISHGLIVNIIEGKPGTLWMTTAGGGICYFDIRKQKFYKFPSGNTEYQLSSSFTWGLLKDTNGNLWVGTRNKGVDHVILDPDSDKPLIREVVNYQHDQNNPKSLAGNLVRVITQDDSGNIWFGTNFGLSKLAKDKINQGNFINYRSNKNNSNSLSHNYITSLELDSSGDLWVGTSKGLNRLDQTTGLFSQYYHDNSDYTSLSSDYIMDIEQDKNDDNFLWIATRMNGFNRFNKVNEKSIRFQNKDPSLTESAVWDLYQDNQGSIWIGSYGFGVSYFNEYLKKFNTFYNQPTRSDGLKTSYILSIYKQQNNNSNTVWLGTGGDGLFEHNRLQDSFYQYIYKPNHPRSSLYNMFKCIATKPGNRENEILWIGTTGDGIARFNTRTKKYVDLPSEHAELRKITTAVWDIYFDHDIDKDKVWIATEGAGLYIYDFNKKVLNHLYHDPADSMSLPTNDIQDIFKDNKGRFWIATRGHGLAVFTPESNRYTLLNHDIQDKESIADNWVNSTYQTSNGDIWLATWGGLSKLISKDYKFKNFNESHGLSSNDVAGIYEDNAGDLWLSTTSAISNYNITDQIFTNYNYTNGIPVTSFGARAWFKSNDGEIFFGGNGGYISFYPEEIKKNIYPPTIAITNIWINHESDSRFENESLQQDISYASQITLPINLNTISIEFSALNFINAPNNRYKYKMAGFDEKWINTDASHRIATYTQLDPGTYEFVVRACNNDGIWNENKLSLSITILPPWWQTIYAYLIYILLGISILFALWRMQLRRLHSRQQIEMDRYKAEKLKEIDVIKSRFFANISHEFRTPLTLIEGPITQFLDGSLTGNIKDYCKVVLKNTRYLLNLVNQLLDLSKFESGMLQLQAVNSDIIKFLRGLVQSFESLAGEKGIDLIFESSTDSIDIYLDRNKFEQIINNLLSNAFKNTPDGGTIKIAVKNISNIKDSHAGFLQIEIHNTGSYIPANELDNIFDRYYQVNSNHTQDDIGTGIGLALVKELVELHQGEIKVESDSEIGTKFSIFLHLGYEHLANDQIISNQEIDTDYSDTAPEKYLSESFETAEKSIFTHTKKSVPSILIIDDNSDVLNYLYSLLHENYNVIMAGDGFEGYGKALKEQPDIIISDVMMPNMDGFELSSKIKENLETSHIPIILLTARGGDRDRENGWETGADDYIAKPFQARELKLRVKNILHQRERIHRHFVDSDKLNLDKLAITSTDEKFLNQLSAIVNNEMQNSEFTISNIADRMNISYPTLIRKIKALINQTPSEYLKIMRLKRARQLLHSGFGNVSETAFKVGYNSLSQFSKNYIKQFGIPPSKDH